MYSLTNFLVLVFLAWSLQIRAQQAGNTLSLLFMGDIMGHTPQINGAYDSKTKTYDYQPVFDKIKHQIQSVDFAIANLEVTLAGKPFKGYPQFSSPDELAVACKNSGIDVLVTANNHSCDRGKQGIIRTLNVLDSLNIAHTGTFRNQEEFQKNNLLILSKNGISVGILNYTYGTNGLPIPESTIVNIIDLEKMKGDIDKAKQQNIDKLIVAIHWGIEYQQKQNKSQEEIAHFLFENGVDIIVGGHPHVLQPMYFYPATGLHNEKLIVYSLGNFISNQRKTPSDGGAMLEITLFKDSQQTYISKSGYHLVWVNKFPKTNSTHFSFEILPCKLFENNDSNYLSTKDFQQMKQFIENSRNLFKNNFLVTELD